jgi:uncharacterized protein
MELIYLCLFAFFAGFIDSISGGGGLIQLPALFLFLPPSIITSSPAAVLGTNKFSAVCGTLFAGIRYAKTVGIQWRTVLPMAVAAFICSFLGAQVVSLLPGSMVKPLVLVLLVVVAAYTFLRKDFGNLHAPRLSPTQDRMIGIAVGIVLGFYDGFFGPGMGSFLMVAFIGIFGFDFLNASASTKFVNVATNLAALIYFAAHGNVLYEYAIPMGLCNVAGAVIGTRLAILKGNRFVRVLFLMVIGAMILRFGWDIFGTKPLR